MVPAHHREGSTNDAAAGAGPSPLSNSPRQHSQRRASVVGAAAGRLLLAGKPDAKPPSGANLEDSINLEVLQAVKQARPQLLILVPR